MPRSFLSLSNRLKVCLVVILFLQFAAVLALFGVEAPAHVLIEHNMELCTCNKPIFRLVLVVSVLLKQIILLGIKTQQPILLNTSADAADRFWRQIELRRDRVWLIVRLKLFCHAIHLGNPFKDAPVIAIFVCELLQERSMGRSDIICILYDSSSRIVPDSGALFKTKEFLLRCTSKLANEEAVTEDEGFHVSPEPFSSHFATLEAILDR